MPVPDDDGGHSRLKEVLHRGDPYWRPAKTVLRARGGLPGRGHVRWGHQWLQGSVGEGWGLLPGKGWNGKGTETSKTGTKQNFRFIMCTRPQFNGMKKQDIKSYMYIVYTYRTLISLTQAGKRDYYKILGVKRTATKKEISKVRNPKTRSNQ